jgi:5-methylcytosine-specific restriction endonuclease McrA
LLAESVTGIGCVPGPGRPSSEDFVTALASSVSILVLDAGGTPRRWIGVEEAVAYYCKEQVAWDYGEHSFTLRGGISRASGQQSSLTLRSIVAVRGDRAHRAPLAATPALTREMLFARDCHVCAYCGRRLRPAELTAEHVQPRSRGGKTSWTNLVSACKPCNLRKGDRTPEQARMPLLYVPYVPSLCEAFILRNRRILADQMAFLMAGVPAGSRLRDPLQP